MHVIHNNQLGEFFHFNDCECTKIKGGRELCSAGVGRQ